MIHHTQTIEMWWGASPHLRNYARLRCSRARPRIAATSATLPTAKQLRRMISLDTLESLDASLDMSMDGSQAGGAIAPL